MNGLAIIPARGGSKGVPRKNLRPLAGRPLIYYAITSCLKAKSISQVVVSTDDEEIALFAKRFGASILMRPHELADDAVPLDPVIVHEAKRCAHNDTQFSAVVTVQPTSPLITPEDIDSAMQLLHETNSDTIISVVESKHLQWGVSAGQPVPLYKERVNRQLLPDQYKETGAIIACTWKQLTKGSRLGSKISLYVVPSERSVDIDSQLDFYICEKLLQRKRIIFVVAGNSTVGLGHVYRSLLLAHELVHHDIYFICEKEHLKAHQVISNFNYRSILIEKGGVQQKLQELAPDLVINDILDTKKEYVLGIKSLGAKVINFEDVGEGAGHADLVINALYPNIVPTNNLLAGPKWFCLRDEFIFQPPDLHEEERLLLTFGGVDEGNITCRILSLVAKDVLEKGINIDVVLGPGYAHHNELDKLVAKLSSEKINVVKETTKISEYMFSATAAVTSGGRTVFELISTTTPTIVICQNSRETTHTAASSENGIINLGYRKLVSDSEIREAIFTVLDNPDVKETMKQKMTRLNLKNGKNLVLHEINKILQG